MSNRPDVQETKTHTIQSQGHPFFEGMLFTLFVAFVVIDLAVTSFPELGSGAGDLWSLSHAPIAFLAAVEVFRFFALCRKGESVLTSTAILVFAVWLVCSLLYSQRISSETIEQIFCATKQMSGPTAGFRETCFLGYPTRGYFLIALPAYFFGHSFSMLGLGYAVFLFVSLVVFAGGFQRYLTSLQISARHADLCVVLALLLSLHINPVHEILTYFEQIQLPLAYGFIITGLTLRYLSTREVGIAWLMGIVLVQATFVYTPAMLVVPAGICFFSIIVISSRSRTSERVAAGVIAAGTFVSLISSYLLFGSRNISSFVANHDVPHLMLREVAASLLLPEVQPAVFTVASQAIFSVTFFAAVAGYLGREVVMCGLWIAVGATFSVLGGYSEWSIPYSMYRMAAGFPVWTVIAVLCIEKVVRRLRLESVALRAVGLLLFAALFLGDTGFGQQRQDDRIPLAAIAKRLDADPTTGPLHGVAVSDDVVEVFAAMQWFDQILRHVLPDVRVIRGCPLVAMDRTLIFTRSDSVCSTRLAEEATKIEQYSNGEITIESFVFGPARQ